MPAQEAAHGVFRHADDRLFVHVEGRVHHGADAGELAVLVELLADLVVRRVEVDVAALQLDVGVLQLGQALLQRLTIPG